MTRGSEQKLNRSPEEKFVTQTVTKNYEYIGLRANL